MKRLSVILLLLLAGCSNDTDKAWLGYAEGDTAFVAAPQAGWVSRMTINRGDWVSRGEHLFTLDDTHEIAARDQAVANLVQAKAELVQEQANLVYTQRSLQRQQGLARARAGVPTTLDQTLASYRQSQGHIAQLEGQISQMSAALNDANYQLSQRDVVALTEGRVQDIYYWPGEYAPAMTPIVAILPPDHVFVRFFVPESEFARIHLGDKVAISCDGCATGMTATISFIASQEEYTPPVIFSIGSREKLVFKIEARAPGGLKLNPGQPVEVRPL
jgi:HlyD family secretion protein